MYIAFIEEPCLPLLALGDFQFICGPPEAFVFSDQMRLKPANFKEGELAERYGNKTEKLQEVDTRILGA